MRSITIERIIWVSIVMILIVFILILMPKVYASHNKDALLYLVRNNLSFEYSELKQDYLDLKMYTETLEKSAKDKEAKIAKQNENLLHFTSELLNLTDENPTNQLNEYLQALYDTDTSKAYTMVSSQSKLSYPYEKFKETFREMTLFNLNSVEFYNGFMKDGDIILEMEIQQIEDPATSSFSMIRENGGWYVLLNNHQFFEE